MSMGKRFYALLLAVAMILGMIPAGVFAEDVQATPLTLDQELSVEIAEAQASVWLSFTPEETGSYIFRSVAEEDTTAVLYDENKEYLSENDDSGRESNFSLTYTLEKGKTYYYEVSFYSDETGTIPVKVYPNPIKSIVEARAYIYENIHGDWVTTSTENGQEIEYFQYDYTNTPTLGYTVKFTDGTLKETGGADFEHDGEYYEIRSLDEQCSDNQWEGGKTYTGQIGVAGVFGDVEVHIEKFPAKSLELNPITIEENTWGYHDTFTNPEPGEEESYFYYTWNEKVSGTIIFEDDSTTEVSCGGFGHYDVWLDLPVKDKQGRSESWTLGNTYEGIVTCGALEVTVPITIVEAEDPGPEPDPEEPEDLNAIPLTLDEETTAQITEPDGAVWSPSHRHRAVSTISPPLRAKMSMPIFTTRN